MPLECSIWRECAGGDAVARVSDVSPLGSFRGRPACRACLDALRADPTVEVRVEERFRLRA